jgi:hypothetical protein
LSVIALAMFCSSTVLPVRGGATIRRAGPCPAGDEVDHPGDLSLTVGSSVSSVQLLVRVERGEVVEIDPVAHRIGIVEIDLGQLGEREIALAILGRADLAFDRVAGAQAPFADLVGRDIDIVRPGEVVRFGLRRKPKPSGSTSIVPMPMISSPSSASSLRMRTSDPAGAWSSAFDAQFFGHRDQFGRGLFLEFFQMHVSP